MPPPFAITAAGPLPVPRIPGQRRSARDAARARLGWLLLAFMVVPAALTVRLIDLSILEARPAPPRARLVDAPPRADIVDRNGVELAQTFEAYAIAVEPQKLATKPAQLALLAGKIAAILTDRTPAQILAELTSRDEFRYIARRVLPSEAKRINDLGEPAIHLKREAQRLYPNADLAAHAIGYTDDRGHGMIGMERAREARLADPATRGTPLVLSLDVRAQQALADEIRGVMLDQQADGAAGVVMDIATGEVVAMVSLPDFDPNAPGRGTQDGYLNRATAGTYELGSTFKAFTLANGLSAGTITSMSRTWDASRPLQLPGHLIHDDHALNRWLTVPEIFIHSSNIGTARIALETGRDSQRAMLEALGFFKPVDIEIGERKTPGFPAVSDWREAAIATIGYGHGISVTPLHLASGYATLVNGGIYRPPTLLKRAPGAVPAGRRVFSQATSDTMRALLRLVVLKGTGKTANAPGYHVGGKTGTATKNRNGVYLSGHNVSTFAAAFPMEAPRYVIIAMIDDPKGSKASSGLKTAGMVVAPMIARLVQRIGPILGVQPDSGRDIDVSGLMHDTGEIVKE